MQFHRNEIFLLYNPNTSAGKQTKAIALTVNPHINEVNIMCEKLGPTYWKEVVTMLDVEPKELLDRSNPDYQAKVRGNSYTMTGWLDVLMHNPQLLKAPIAIYNGKAVLCNTPTDIFKLGVRAISQRATEKVLPHLRIRH
jgi:arsenate reductase (glutaredoxin)